ncbi:MAG: PilZ domain-containing protein [Acidobacteria bacterium]|nr:PilZ domain-containing protein [Acidobacteriota bacterium]
MDRHDESLEACDGHERRAHPRIPARSVPYLTARIAGGPAVHLIDLSKHGVQIETTLHMRPGSTVAVRFLSGDRSVTLTGAVVRSTELVRPHRGDVKYHSALSFTDELSLCDEAIQAAEPAREPQRAVVPQVSVCDLFTMILMDGCRPSHAYVEATAR